MGRLKIRNPLAHGLKNTFVHDSVLWGECGMWTESKYSQSRRLDASPSVGKSEFCPVSSVKWTQASNEIMWVLYIPIPFEQT